MNNHKIISFTTQDIAVFSQVSGDRNPLHLSEAYARRTPYGQPVIFGCLGAMACLGRIRLPDGSYPASLKAEFLRPIFVGVNYRIETAEKKGKLEARLFDGSTPVVSLTVSGEMFSGSETLGQTREPGAFSHREAAAREPESIVPGLTVSGVYGGSNPADLDTLAARWGVLDRLSAIVLSWASYLVGMELPGESALFSKLLIRLHRPVRFSGPMTYRATVASVDSRFGMVEIDVSLCSGDTVIASGQCSAYVRPPVPGFSDEEFAGVSPVGLAGRVAVILGSSRGLGAAIRRALDLRGAVVYGMSRSADAAEWSRTEVGDAADLEALRRLRERVEREYQRLDVLICNACPPALPLRVESNTARRIADYVQQAVSCTLTPLGEFLDLLNRSDGCVVIISSVFVENPAREFPHYVAAKAAVEALARVASLQYSRIRILIVRPPKLLTAMTNTPLGRVDAISPGLFANRIAARLEDPLEPGKPEILG